MKRTRGLLILAACAVASAPPAVAAGDPLVREPDRILEAVPAGERPQGEEPVLPGRQVFSPRVPDRRVVERAKARAARKLERRADRQRGAATGSGGEFAPRAAIFAGLNEPGLAAGDGSPPDATGAIGPSDYVEMVNNQIGLFSRSNLTQTAVSDLDDFIGFPGENVFDPQVKWDPGANRFLFVADDCVADCVVGDKFLAFGWSKTADPGNLISEGPDLPANPAADWCTFFIDTGVEFHDYPKLGSNDNHIIIGANAFAGDTFLSAVVWAIPKPAAGQTSCGAGPAASRFGTALAPLLTADGDAAFTPVPASTFTPAANGYVVASDFFEDSEIMAWHVSGPAESPTLTADGNIAVAHFGVPPNVPQPGTSDTLDSLDTRLTQAQAAADPTAGGTIAVWTQHTIAGGGRSVVRWYELLPGACSAGGCPPVARLQQGTISGPGLFAFNGAISPAANGHAAVVNYNVGSAGVAPEIRARSRQLADPLGQMRAEVTLGTSSNSTEEFTCQPPLGPPCRWGDYAGASPDPLNSNVVWGSNQLIGAAKPDPLDPHWTTRNFALLADHFPPQTTITSGPAQDSTTADPTPKFDFAADEPAAFQCRLDAGGFGACSGPGASHTTAALTPGPHTFRVRAIDLVGNVDPTPAVRSFTFAPVETTVTGKRIRAKRGQATFSFKGSGGVPPYTFKCKLGGKRAKPRLRRFRSCTSPKTYRRLKRGRYQFVVRAIDAEGFRDRTPAKVRFRSKRST